VGGSGRKASRRGTKTGTGEGGKHKCPCSKKGRGSRQRHKRWHTGRGVSNDTKRCKTAQEPTSEANGPDLREREREAVLGTTSKKRQAAGHDLDETGGGVLSHLGRPRGMNDLDETRGGRVRRSRGTLARACLPQARQVDPFGDGPEVVAKGPPRHGVGRVH
jgi:hypothetical protein